jgi:predicted nucleic-acid-binding protein
MKIILDTNVVFRDYLFQSAPLQALSKYLSWTDDELIIPEVILEEAIRHFSEAYEESENSYDSINALLQNIGRELDPIPNKDEAVALFRKRLLERINELDAKLLPLPSVGIQEVLERDLKAKRPFDRKGRGLRDTLIWHNILDELNIHDEQIALISTDGDFEQNKKDKTNDPVLHNDLQEELANLGFSTDRVIIYRTVQSFNEKYVFPLVDRVYRKGEPIQPFFESLDIPRMLDYYGEYAAREIHENLPLIIPLGAFADRVSFLNWLEDYSLLEALDLKAGSIQSIVRSRIVFDTEVFGSQDGFSRLMDFSKGRAIIIGGISAVPDSSNLSISVRISILVDFVILWNIDTDTPEGFAVLRFGFTEEEINQSPISLL